MLRQFDVSRKADQLSLQQALLNDQQWPYMATLEQWRKQLQNIRGIFQNFRLSYVRQI